MQGHERYKVQRLYFRRPGVRRTLKTGLTLAQAQAHCSDPETSSRSCRYARNVKRTEQVGEWFDSYTQE
jgi:hypothetical protein